jgi:hypothetical protein
MALQPQICEKCKDVIFDHDKAVIIRLGSFNSKEFEVEGIPSAYHHSCFLSILSRSSVMEEIIKNVSGEIVQSLVNEANKSKRSF